ncbi:MAG: hypothetical protein R3244_04875 [Thermoanaerobaculia bacterium]|nr:hypothetical protein [Thermoanaerobaculia bacterium]
MPKPPFVTVRRSLCLLSVPFLAAACGAGPERTSNVAESFESRHEVAARHLVFESEEFVIGRKIDSMDGPSGVEPVELSDVGPDELVWLTGIRNRAIDAVSDAEMSQEFLCHSNLSWGSPDQLERRTSRFRATRSADSRVMTLIQGQNELELPAGFGVPMVAGEPLQFFTMVINKNSDDLPLRLKVRTELEYRRQDDLDRPLVPLFKRRLYNAVETDATLMAHQDGGHGGAEHAAGGHDGAKVAAAPSAMQHSTLEWDEDGTRYGMHWMVPPGRHEYRTPVGGQLELPFDTTVHYVTAHLHPYGESITLEDVSTGETVFRLRAHPYTDRLGIAAMESFSSRAGVPLSRHGSYELVTIYDNPTEQPVDAMGILYLYLRDHGFEFLAPGDEG